MHRTTSRLSHAMYFLPQNESLMSMVLLQLCDCHRSACTYDTGASGTTGTCVVTARLSVATACTKRITSATAGNVVHFADPPTTFLFPISARVLVLHLLSPLPLVYSQRPPLKNRRHPLNYDPSDDYPPKRRFHPCLALRLHPLASSISLPFPHTLPIS
jgi:hypothetical protein